MSNPTVPAAAEGLPAVHPFDREPLEALVSDAAKSALVASVIARDAIGATPDEKSGLIRMFAWEWELLLFTIQKAKAGIEAVEAHLEAAR